MFKLQFFDGEINHFQSLKFKIVENDAGGDCLFMSILAFLKSNKMVLKESHQALREMIVRKAVSDMNLLQLQEIKFNLENHVQFFSSLNLDELHINDDLQKQCLIEYMEYMSKPGHCGTLFELAIATQIFSFEAVVFMKQGDQFKCFDLGVADDDKNDTKPKLFILFTGPVQDGHFRLLKPSSIEIFKSSYRIPRGEYVIVKEDLVSFILKKGRPTQQANDATVKCNMLICPFCCDSTKAYKGQAGLKIHIARMHPGESYKHVPVVHENGVENFKDVLGGLRRKIRILKRIPRGARTLAAKKLSEIINGCVITNDEKSWERLMTFSYYALRVPKKSSKSLVSIVKKNLSNIDDMIILHTPK